MNWFLENLKFLIITLIVGFLSFLLFKWISAVLIQYNQSLKFGLLILTFSGAIGGLISALLENEGRFAMLNYMGGKNPSLNFGSFVNIIIGIITAFAAFFIIRGPLNIEITSHDSKDILGLIFVGVLSGVSGKSLLYKLVTGFEAQIAKVRDEAKRESKENAKEAEESAERKSKAAINALRAEQLLSLGGQSNLELAEKGAKEAIKNNENYLKPDFRQLI